MENLKKEKTKWNARLKNDGLGTHLKPARVKQIRNNELKQEYLKDQSAQFQMSFSEWKRTRHLRRTKQK